MTTLPVMLSVDATDSTSQPIAPWWHTVLVLLPIALGSIASAYQHGLSNANLPGMSFRLSGWWFLSSGSHSGAAGSLLAA